MNIGVLFFANKGIPYIFAIDPNSSMCSFDPSIFGDDEALKINYSFPSKKVSEIKQK